MARLAIVCCTVGICAALSSTAFAQDAAPPPAAGGSMTTTTVATAPAGSAGAAMTITTNASAPQLVVVEPPPDTRPKQGLEKAPPEEPIMFRKGLFGVLGAVNDSPTILPAATVADHFFVGVGLQFAWNDNTSATGGLASASNPPCTAATATTPSSCPGGAHKFNSNLVVAGEYMIIDKLPFALGPELTILGSLAPDRVFTTLVFEPGIAFWYAPFRAPLVLGSALDAEIITQNGPTAAKAQVTILTPGLRLGYIFN
jgi:hypothetical protein